MHFWSALISLAIGFGLRFLVTRVESSPTKTGRFFSRRLGIDPSGPDGAWALRDHLRATGAGIGAFAIALGIYVPLMLTSEGLGQSAWPGIAVGALGFTALVIGAAAAVWGLTHLLQAALDPWQPKRPGP